MKLKAAAASMAMIWALSGTNSVSADGFKQSAINDNISLLQGKGGNIAVIEGSSSLLVIDDDYADAAPLLYQSILGVADKPIRFLVNTHWHFDHSGGNELLGTKTNLVAHNNVRTRLKNGQEMKAFGRVVPPAKPQALPVVTYSESMTLYEAGESVELKHFPNGHTDGDSVVFIQPANIVHMGDLYFQGQLPFVDLESGGSVQGLAANIAAVLDMIDEKTVVIPGHGPLSNKQELAAYQRMLADSIAMMQSYKKAGLSLDAIKQRGIGKDLQTWETGFIKAESWLTTLYHSVN